MISCRTTFLACALAAVPMTAFAQNSGTQAEQDACTPDVLNLCQDFIPNEAPIVACLRSKRMQLSTACASVMFPAAQTGPRRGGKAHHRRKRHT